jgi:hypothetical protein
MSAPTRQVPRSRLLPLIAVTMSTFVFTLLLILVRTQWSPLESVDRSLAADLNNLVADRPTVAVRIVSPLRALAPKWSRLPGMVLPVGGYQSLVDGDVRRPAPASRR